jgi:hypothetical protein
MAWVASVKPSVDGELVTQAIAAVDRIIGPESELRDLREETGDFNDRQVDVASLRAQLQT